MIMQIEQSLDKARELRRGNRHEEALAILREITAADPSNADAWWITGLAHHSLDQLDESLTALRQTLRHAPGFTSGWAQYGVVLGAAGKIEEAKKAFAHALRIDPRHVFALSQAARICKEAKDYEGQIQHLTALDALEKADANDLILLGNAHWEKKHFSRAIEYYSRSAAAWPDPAPYFNLALVYSRSEVSQDVDAVDSLYRALRLRTDYARAKKMLLDLTPRLETLAKESLKTGETLLDPSEWFQFYLNPFELLGATRDQPFEEFDHKTIQRLKRLLLHEIDLEEGRLERFEGFVLDKSRVIGLCEELHDDNLKNYHWKVFQNPFLLWFLTRGDIRHFLYRASDYVTTQQVDEDHRKKKEKLIEELTVSLSNILLGEMIPLDIVNGVNGEIIIPANRKITKTLLRKLATLHDHAEIVPGRLCDKIREVVQPYAHKFAEADAERQREIEKLERASCVNIVELLEELDVEWSGFREWLSKPFARQYDLVLSRALQKEALPVIESLFDGRRWVLRAHEEICFSGAHRYVGRLIEPFRNFAQFARTKTPLLSDVEKLLSDKNALAVINLLPQPFRDQQADAARAIRDIAVASYNQHDDIDLSQAILALSKRFHFKNAELTQRLEADFQEIQKLIAEERKHEAKLTLGKDAMEITKEGVRKGSTFIGAQSICSIRWGILVSGHDSAPTYEFLLGFRDEVSRELIFSWRSSGNLQEQEKFFNQLVQAALNYIVPNLLTKVQSELEKGYQIRVGNCTLRRDDISFEIKSWLSSKTHVVPWHLVGTEARNGILTVYDQANPRTRTTMVLCNSENAVVLQLLATMKKKNQDL